MGLFDRFRRKIKEAPHDEGLLAEESSEEAERAISEKIELTKKEVGELKANHPVRTSEPEGSDEWDDEPQIEDPFAKTKGKKAKKLAMREAASKRASSRKPDTEQDPMQTTTGFRLVPAEPSTFEVDLTDTEVDRGGMIIRGGEVLDGILEELENDLLSVDMGHAATEGLIHALRMRIVGSRITTKTPLASVIEKALRESLRRLLEAGYWDFDRTVRSILSEDTPVVIMIVGVNGTGKTTTSAKIAHRLREDGYSVVMARGGHLQGRSHRSARLSCREDWSQVHHQPEGRGLGRRRPRCCRIGKGQGRRRRYHRHGWKDAKQDQPDGGAQEGPQGH